MNNTERLRCTASRSNMSPRLGREMEEITVMLANVKLCTLDIDINRLKFWTDSDRKLLLQRCHWNETRPGDPAISQSTKARGSQETVMFFFKQAHMKSAEG